MPRKPNSEETSLIEEQVIQAFLLTTAEDRSKIAEIWNIDRNTDVAEYTEKTKLPPIALIIASLIDTESPILVSPSRGVMWSAMGCWIVVAAFAITGTPLNGSEAQKLLNLVTSQKDSPVAKPKLTGRNNKKLYTMPVENPVYNFENK